MDKYLIKDSDFYIIPEEIEKITRLKLESYDDKNLVFSLEGQDYKVKSDTNAEFFKPTDDGLLYFSSVLYEINKNFLVIPYPQNFELLQRRENERVSLNLNIVLLTKEKFELKAKLENLSVSGFSLLTQNKIKLNETYDVNLSFDTLNIECKFIPKRIKKINKNYSLSGIIEYNNESDKITVMQYCYNKSLE